MYMEFKKTREVKLTECKMLGRRMRPLMPSNRVKPLTPHATSSPPNLVKGGQAYTLKNNKFEDMAARKS
jgi:hypothetical protein